jgi:hypothetical protein
MNVVWMFAHDLTVIASGVTISLGSVVAVAMAVVCAVMVGVFIPFCGDVLLQAESIPAIHSEIQTRDSKCNFVLLIKILSFKCLCIPELKAQIVILKT